MYKRLVTFVIALSLTLGMTAQNKREFRGAWIQCVNGQFMGKSTQEIQTMLSNQLDELQKDGVNAIIFQVRAECDALYESDLEPWSKFLTGVQGKAPSPYWDPLHGWWSNAISEGWSCMPGSTLIVPSMVLRAWGNSLIRASSSSSLISAFLMTILCY